MGNTHAQNYTPTDLLSFLTQLSQQCLSNVFHIIVLMQQVNMLIQLLNLHPSVKRTTTRHTRAIISLPKDDQGYMILKPHPVQKGSASLNYFCLINTFMSNQ